MIEKVLFRISLLAGVPLIAVADAATNDDSAQKASSDGSHLYAAHCAECHGPSLAGTDIAPPLSGGYFRSQWQFASVNALRDKIVLTMPSTAPGSLSTSQYTAIMNFILDKNGQKPDEEELFAK